MLLEEKKKTTPTLLESSLQLISFHLISKSAFRNIKARCQANTFPLLLPWADLPLCLNGFPYLLAAVIFPRSGPGALQKPSWPACSRSSEAVTGRISARREILGCNPAALGTQGLFDSHYKEQRQLFEINTEIIFGGCERPGLSPPRIFKQSCDLNNHPIFLLGNSKSSKVGRCNCRRRLTPAWTADLLLLLKPPITSTFQKSTDKIHTQILTTWKRSRSVFSYLRVISFSWFKVTWTTCSLLFIWQAPIGP